MAIDPWAYGANLKSPNGSLVATISDASEIAMGAPTSGTLTISNGITIPHCNPSMVWSEDSQYLAVPQWTDNNSQNLVIISMIDAKQYMFKTLYRVLELSKFIDGEITGVDSPIHKTKKLKVQISDIIKNT